LVVRLHRICSSFEACACARTPAIDTMDPELWPAILEFDAKEYRDNTLWRQHGINRNGIDVEHPWKCHLCAHRPVFMTLGECEPHCETKAHKKALYWRFTHFREKVPDAPKWSSTPAEGAGSWPIFGGPPSRSAQPASLQPAADLRDPSPAAPAGTRKCRVELRRVMFNGGFVEEATLEMNLPCSEGSPPLETQFMHDVTIDGRVRPADGSTAHGSSLRSPHSQMPAGASVVAGSSSLDLSVEPGMAVVLVAPTQPPQSRPPRQAAGAPRRSGPWSGRARRLGDGETESSGSPGTPMS